MEWDAVYCGNKLKHGYVNELAKKTAGGIAKDICRFASRIAEPAVRARYQAAATWFSRLVESRNDLVHSNPAKVGGKQLLVRHGSPWQISEIDALADEFTACSLELNDLHHHVL